jgi:Sulfotransferase family
MRLVAAGNRPAMSGALPTVIVIGAMKCGTTALHSYLDAHPEIGMARDKEVNFFIGGEVAPNGEPDTWWRSGQWHRGVGWYAGLFEATLGIRGETSPGYTSPASPEVVDRMAAVVPEAKLVYLVRDPVERAVSQYRHHRRDGSETRSLEEALLDPSSQYVDRSRFAERLRPFLNRFPAEQVLVVVQERLLRDRAPQLARVYRYVGADPAWHGDVLGREFHVGDNPLEVPRRLRSAFLERVGDDVDRLRALVQDDLVEWAA